MSDLFIHSIELVNFRSHLVGSFIFTSNIVAIIGKNGSGKTSLLEGVSMFGGRSLLGADNRAMININNVSANANIAVQNLYNINLLITNNRCQYTLNDKPCRLNKLYDIMRIISFTPGSHYAFLSTTSRRDLFNYYISIIDAKYNTLLLQYNKFTRERLKILLSSNSSQSRWLDAVEMQIAEHGLELARIRHEVCSAINKTDRLVLRISGNVDNLFTSEMEIINIKEVFLRELLNNRATDCRSERTIFSAHRFDIDISGDDLSFNKLSHSRQKMRLLDLLLSIADVIQNKHKLRPILLIDELMASFDDSNITSVLKNISTSCSQVFFTSPVLPKTDGIAMQCVNLSL